MSYLVLKLNFDRHTMKIKKIVFQSKIRIVFCTVPV